MRWIISAAFLVLAVLLAAGDLADAAPNGRRCKHKLQRKAWYVIRSSYNLETGADTAHFFRHRMSKHEKAAYIKAEKCLMKLPAKMGFVGTRTRFDELQAVHVMAGEKVHENVSLQQPFYFKEYQQSNPGPISSLPSLDDACPRAIIER